MLTVDLEIKISGLWISNSIQHNSSQTRGIFLDTIYGIRYITYKWFPIGFINPNSKLFSKIIWFIRTVWFSNTNTWVKDRYKPKPIIYYRFSLIRLIKLFLNGLFTYFKMTSDLKDTIFN